MGLISVPTPLHMSSEIFNEINAQERKLTEKKTEQNLSQ